MTAKQRALAKKHGTPTQFETACTNAWFAGDITDKECDRAVAKYNREWIAGMPDRDIRYEAFRAKCPDFYGYHTGKRLRGCCRIKRRLGDQYDYKCPKSKAALCPIWTLLTEQGVVQ